MIYGALEFLANVRTGPAWSLRVLNNQASTKPKANVISSLHDTGGPLFMAVTCAMLLIEYAYIR
jgi:hypothetical protein